MEVRKSEGGGRSGTSTLPLFHSSIVPLFLAALAAPLAVWLLVGERPEEAFLAGLPVGAARLGGLVWALAVAVSLGIFACALLTERPAGALRGRVIAADTGQALAGVKVFVRPVALKDGVAVRRVIADASGRFAVAAMP